MGTLKLPCTMTDHETDHESSEAGLQLASANRDLTSKEDEKREASRGFNEEIKARKVRVNTLAAQVTSGVIRRDVEVDYRVPAAGGPKVLFRLDTDPPEPVPGANIDPDERQLELGKERRQAVGESLTEILAAAIVLPNEDDGFTARAAANPPMWEQLPTATGDTEEEARAALLERLIDLTLMFDEAQAHQRSEAIMTRLGELLATATVRSEADGGTWTCEAMGDDEATAKTNLREKLLAQLQAEATEVKELAAEQAADDAKGKKAGAGKPPRRGLKPPKKGPKPKTHKRTKYDDNAPPNGRDGKPLGF